MQDGVFASNLSFARMRVQPRIRMRENRASGSVPEAPGNRRPYGGDADG